MPTKMSMCINVHLDMELCLRALACMPLFKVVVIDKLLTGTIAKIQLEM